ncbi:MAG: hypothetical protein MUF54_10650 [Polyangiaceae bacterium]|jgi:hypothetical protein|nr:hypothetical protein [Polyangiaceae bacterium]
MTNRPATVRVRETDLEEHLDSIEDVPAAVVCARCGRPDCSGCIPPDETTLPSGVISIVPWERPGSSWWARLWLTARAATRAAPQFFQSLPPGDYAAAIRFAVLTELLAVGSWAVFILLIATAAAPSIMWALFVEPGTQAVMVRLFVFGVLGFASVLVLGHVVHGLALEQGALRQGASSHRSHVLRYALYSTGWDILSSPIGLLLTLTTEGPRAALALLPLAIDVPSQASTGLLRGVFHLQEPHLSYARRFATLLAMVVSVAATATVMFLLTLIAAI